MGFFSQLWLLSWKNLTLRRRQKFRLVAEIVFPLALFIILVIVRTRPNLKIPMSECHYDGNAMPSAGALPFVQSFLCNFNNPCHATASADETPGTIGSFDQSFLTRVVKDLSKVLQDNSVITLAHVLRDFEFYTGVLNNIGSGNSTGNITLGSLVVNPQQIISGFQDNDTRQAIIDLFGTSININMLNSTLVNDILEDVGVCRVPNLNSTGVNPSTNLTLLQAQFRNVICDQDQISQIFNFTSEPARDLVSNQLCNLTNPESIGNVIQLLEELQRTVNATTLFEELQRFALANAGSLGGGGGSGPTIDASALPALIRAYQDIQQLSSVGDLVNEFQRLIQDVSLGSGMDLGSMVCGRSNSVLGASGTSLLAGLGGLLTTGGVQTGGSVETGNNTYNATANVTVGQSGGVCDTITKMMYSSRTTRVLWKQILPMLQGEILYYPDTPAVRKIIKEANQTFEEFANVINLARNFSQDYYFDLYNYLNNSANIEFLRTLTGSCLCDLAFDQLRSTSNISSNYSACSSLNAFLNNGNSTGYDWRNAINATRSLALGIAEFGGCFNLNKFKGYKNQRQMINDGVKKIEDLDFWAALEFQVSDNDQDPLPTHVKYSIRMDTAKVDSTTRIQDKYWRPGPRSTAGIDTKYITYGFAYIQDMIDHAIINIQTNKQVNIGVETQQFPYPCYTRDRFIYAISRSLPLFLVLAWVLSVAMICKSIVYEKENRLKEVMKIMGLSNAVHWVAWFINSFVMMFITILILTIILKAGRVLEHSDPGVIIVFLTAFAISTIMQCFLYSTFFNRANLAACVAGFLYFIMYLPYTLAVQWEDFMTTGHKVLSCFSSGVAFGWGCNYLATYEEQAIGIQWSNIATSPIVDDEFNMLSCIFMMLFDAVIYGIFTWYIEAVFPGQYGIARKFYFPFQKSYWCGVSSTKAEGRAYLSNTPDVELGNGDANLEAEPKNRKLGVSIKNLRKVYKQGKKLAVDNLSINFYEGQITSFLGHNGAGKTTTMSILTGLFEPTDGTAYIYGYDIRSEMDNIRKGLGMCPQHNVLFDGLTVEEHLWFFARLRGLEDDKVKAEMEHMIKDVGLPHKRKELSSSLSGGMKRKLSVAIAFCGNAKTVILDEPTAGVDPYARRSIWELLIKLKKKRTIILSTHHMDEADVLGDRIAIISHGKLCCCGSSLYLKSQYGSGFYLTLVRGKEGECEKDMDSDDDSDDDYPDDTLSLDSRPSTVSSIRTVRAVKATLKEQEDEGYDENSKSDSGSDPPSKPSTPPPEGAFMIPGFSIDRLGAFIKRHVKLAYLIEETTTEMVYQLPDDEAELKKFESLFIDLEKNHKSLGISSFGISDTSLEEVFLKVAEQAADAEMPDEVRRSRLEDLTDSGRFARPVSRLSFRRKKKKSFLKSLASRKRFGRIDSEELISDTESIASEAISEAPTEAGFRMDDYKKVNGKFLFLRQFQAQFIKRFHHLRRSKKGFFFEVIMPALFVLLAMVFSEIRPPDNEQPPLELQPWRYVPKKGDKHLYVFYSNDGKGQDWSDSIVQSLLTRPGIGNRCMNPSVYSINDYPCTGENSNWVNFHPIYANTTIDSPSCSCDTGFQKCPAGAGGPDPPQKLLPSSDYLYNMTGRNISDWLVKTIKRYQRRRFGGFSFGDEDPLAAFNATELRIVLDELFTVLNNGTSVTSLNESVLTQTLEGLATQRVNKVWYNNKGWFAVVAYMSAMNNLILRSNLDPSLDPTRYGITTVNHPMELTKAQLTEKLLYQAALDVVIAICVIFAMSFVPASFTMVLIEERASNSKHLQFVSGVNPIIYWLSNFLWDMINYLMPCLICIIIFVAFDNQSYVGPNNWPCLVLLMFLYGWAMIPLMYPFSRLFSIPSTSMVVLQSVNVFLGTTATLATYVIEFLQADDEELKNINDILKRVFLLLPQYGLGRGLMDMAYNQRVTDTAALLGEEIYTDPFEFEQVGRNLLTMFCIGILFFTLNLLIEYNFFIKRGMCFWSPKPTHTPLDDEDEDVAAERKRILSGEGKDDILRLQNLTKVYRLFGKKGRNTAVDRLCVGVPKGQCFGLLGVNGAGKTTTFKMLTGDIFVTEGNAFLNNNSILSDMVQVRRDIGYCPQFDAFDPLLTGREILRFYARLRGVQEKDIKRVSEWAIRKLELRIYADKLSGSYSGGNKRKLSTAISLIGNPQIIFLDEPTTGMDPRARRFLWNCIKNIIKDGRSVILTSHSMEECEALCGRLAIMVNGTFRCLGSTQHLKNRFGDGYTIIVRVAGENPDMAGVEEFITTTFRGSELLEAHHNMLQYQLKSRVKLSYIFGQLEKVKSRLNIEDYSVSQTTLDQVFINFAKDQTDLLDDEIPVKSEKKKSSIRKGNGIFPIGGTSGYTDIDNDSIAGSSLGGSFLELRQPNKRFGGNIDSSNLAYTDEESLTGSTVDLIRPSSARSSTRSSNTMSNVQIF
ncbi:phospholipid-transporting ATPase ABCA1-like isoform X2 [Ostrea edulis]|uniref:phospholipid-transporting ATPase ABCA1-like isoform X2 n=1 Tax=Ostrea edulis TaxID=37623 RepID=UPI0024AF267B|nr:phospholipid-transporting ATPase ABCA1-like isoform X2 [Ostrea edulis]XP_056020267.1 phospholipid-transporting ATPase ABCA1-like isoform X2 [Ostrea edulis]XP_056020268.1 phospholipid-transporting ATPase ABCA1-like isoform X2 [Ostrea edulis]